MFEKPKPKWWQLAALAPLVVGLAAVESHLSLSTDAHQLLEIGIVLLAFGLVFRWARANEAALLSEEVSGLEWSLPSNTTEQAEGEPAYYLHEIAEHVTV